MAYKYKETGIIYKISEFNNYKGQIHTKFVPAMKSDASEINVITKWVYDTDSCSSRTIGLDDYRRMCNANKDAHDRDIETFFEEVSLKPVVKFKEQHDYIKVTCTIDCPVCGSPMKWNKETLLTYPAQYPHQCTNKECCYSFNNARFHEGETFYGESCEEVESMLNGSLQQYEELERRKVLMRK